MEIEDKVTHTTEEIGKAKVQTPTGEVVVVNSKTTYVHYESGRKDCHVLLEKPAGM